MTDHRATIDRARQLGWKVHEHRHQGELRAFAAVKGSEIHLEVCVPGTIRRSVAREFLRPLFDKYGFLTTRINHHDEAGRRFVERTGFKQTWSDDTYSYFMLTALPFER